MKVVIFSRISTLNQDYLRQTEELKEFSIRMGWEVVKVFEETISGKKKNEERTILMSMIDYIEENPQVKKVLTWELSRIGRSPVEVLKTIEVLNEKKISLYIKNYNLETLNDNFELNPLSQFLIQILNSINMMELSTLRHRMKSGYDHYRKNHKVGRKIGFRKDKDQLLLEHKDVVKLLKQEYPIRKIMSFTGKSSGTIQKIKKLSIRS
jgi:DNA invertase Pin-like site-specific DNA recombinase